MKDINTRLNSLKSKSDNARSLLSLLADGRAIHSLN